MRNTSCKFGFQIQDELGDWAILLTNVLWNWERTIWQYATRIHIKIINSVPASAYIVFVFLTHIDIREQKTACCIHFQPFWKISCWEFFHQPSPKKSRPRSQNGSKWYTMFSNPSENCKQPPLFIPLDQSFHPPKWQNCLCSGNPGVLLTSNLGLNIGRTRSWRQHEGIYIYILLIIADLIRTWWQPLMMIPPCRVMFISISIINPSTTATEPPTKLKQNCKSTNLWRLEPLYTKSGTLVSSVQNPHNILSS